MRLSLPAKPGQEGKLIERQLTTRCTVVVCGQEFVALQNVYDTGTDTELMVDVVDIKLDQTFVEIGCGTGAVSLLVGKRAKSGIGVDINLDAVHNANLNKKRLNVKNIEFLESNVFSNVNGTFDVVICNPPYNAYESANEVEMMFWDAKNRMKKNFNQVRNHLKPSGYVYFGWADFGDLDQQLPKKLARKAGLVFIKKYSRKNREEGRTFFVYKFKTLADSKL